MHWYAGRRDASVCAFVRSLVVLYWFNSYNEWSYMHWYAYAPPLCVGHDLQEGVVNF